MEMLWELLEQERLIAIVRASTYEEGMRQAEKFMAGGVRILEISCTTPNAFSLIKAVQREGLLVGAGTVLSQDVATGAMEAGAEFLLAPNFSQEVYRVSDRYGIPYIPGVYTASEVARALGAGISVQKLFPAVTGGMSHLKALADPFPTVRFVPTGGITTSNASEWIKAGAMGVGMGGALARLDPRTIGDVVAELRQIRR